MSDRLVQVNIRIAENSAVRLKELADSARLKLGAFVERLITAYSADSNLLQNDSSAGSWESGIEALRGMIADQDVRLNALEVAVMTGLDAGGREVRVSVQAADLAPMEPVEVENDALPHPAESLPTAQETKAQYEQRIDERIVALRKEGKIIKAIQKELKIGQKRVCKAIKEAGLVG